ncbi:sigma-54-dependent transcriptional regulator [Aneurinibacillus aneurinilyticus]|nr:response regulator [Aneurinibacillus aneurinilyticus]MCI1692608.1 response regulator [Aneurinibacillus aneurinilyticus]MED0705132.1 response regulator [Aneurinibacillus aneurinilyticus]MED0725628.1 response regulator [Aneurinibacillus aneurinilyticus]MED0733832.1 response regulator [Aneurinibacillus aneurinilyticus]MED0742218.1 response regulator [Aneurinibacillus aneurinilyticus]
MKGKPSVLIVDDDTDICFLMATAIQSEHMEIVTAHSGQEALHLYEQHHPELVLLDIQLPEMSGIEVLSRMKEIDEECQVIMVTAYATIETAVQAMKLGALDYICKPFKLPHLRDTVQSAIDFIRSVPEQLPTLEEVERRHIEKVLNEVEGNRRLAAEKLDISLRTLYYKIKQYNIYTP